MCWKWENSTKRPRIDVHFPPLLLLFSPVLFYRFGNIFLFRNRILSCRFIPSGTLTCVTGRMASRYWCLSFSHYHFSFLSVFLPLFILRQNWRNYSMSDTIVENRSTEILRVYWWVKVKATQSLQCSSVFTEHDCRYWNYFATVSISISRYL